MRGAMAHGALLSLLSAARDRSIGEGNPISDTPSCFNYDTIKGLVLILFSISPRFYHKQAAAYLHVPVHVM